MGLKGIEAPAGNSSPPNLSGKVCIVTGASRGIGKGIALQLAKAGAKVYITGRRIEDLRKCAEEMRDLGGHHVIPIQVDHSKEDEIKKLFDKVAFGENGQLDILVNNAYAAVKHIDDNIGKPFWEHGDPAYGWDIVNNVGLRNHFICSTYAARMMVARQSGLIINVSSSGGLMYLQNVAYGVGKCALDRMTQDTAVELKKHNVAVVGLWPGAVRTEHITSSILDNANAPKEFKKLFLEGETPDFSGKAVAYLANDRNILKKSGRILMTYDLAEEYNFAEDDGTLPKYKFTVKNILNKMNHPWLAALFPEEVKMPKSLVYLASNKL